MHLSKVFNGADQGLSYPYRNIFNFELSDGQNANRNTHGYDLQMFELNQNERPIRKVEMYYTSRALLSLVFYDFNGKIIHTVGKIEARAGKPKTVIIRPWERIIGIRAACPPPNMQEYYSVF